MTTPPLLNWRHPSHWAWDAKPCRHCGGPTNLRTSKGWPAHKVCAEHALAQQAAEHRKETLT